MSAASIVRPSSLHLRDSLPVTQRVRISMSACRFCMQAFNPAASTMHMQVIMEYIIRPHLLRIVRNTRYFIESNIASTTNLTIDDNTALKPWRKSKIQGLVSIKLRLSSISSPGNGHLSPRASTNSLFQNLQAKRGRGRQTGKGGEVKRGNKIRQSRSVNAGISRTQHCYYPKVVGYI